MRPFLARCVEILELVLVQSHCKDKRREKRKYKRESADDFKKLTQHLRQDLKSGQEGDALELRAEDGIGGIVEVLTSN
jgi:hypothetical protein